MSGLLGVGLAGGGATTVAGGCGVAGFADGAGSSN